MFAVRHAAAHAVTSACMRRPSTVAVSKCFNPMRATSPALQQVANPHPYRPHRRAALTTRANSGGEKSADGEVDLFRDTPLRYMGYANEVGESFTAFLPVWGVPASYGVAAVYVMMDTVDKTIKAYKGETVDGEKVKRAAVVGLDTFTWQMLASVFWPGSFIRVVVYSTQLALVVADLPPVEVAGIDVLTVLPTAAGLLTIPFIVKPIDVTIDKAMEMSVSKVLNGKVQGFSDAGVALAVIGGCLALPPTLFSVAAAIKDFA
mmetsp:Transcript_18431/g.45841  ORF Transcript_18431/g.45841 Transcript_18431/m.45841 type:complete len:262 (-) Transcript_18431:263-1048(-)|eukprot:CAMPEP_0197575940 /NCGR_PEP_ID=MMETSP1326-20131121/1139_1 /TAXON_ID=1155430 /ORGANISM="Genus nov. species nov., Strain RCC2288" /LENGTH=261 /DNA_ID=CAMNT_0043138775 /DNA_START=83 /DNA_END=868 /DNA_ORIENTATION=+